MTTGRRSLRIPLAMHALAQGVLPAAGGRRARPAAGDPGAAVPDDPLLPGLEPEDGGQGARHGDQGRRAAGQPRGRRARRRTRRRPGPAWSTSARTSAPPTPSSGPGSTRIDSPWGLDDITTAVTEVGDKLDVIMIPKVQGPEDIHYVDRLLAQLEAKAGLTEPILVHAILETASGVARVEEICGASPRMQGLSLGPADLAANRRMKTTRVGGGHPGYVVREDPDPDAARRAPRHLPAGPVALHDRPHGRRLRDPRDPPLLRALRRHRRHRCLRGPVPQRLPDGLRRRLEPAPQPDRDRQAGSSAPTRPTSSTPAG